VVWDRRLRERRRAKASSDVQERRKAERRSPHPVSWTGLGFLVCDRKDRTA